MYTHAGIATFRSPSRSQSSDSTVSDITCSPPQESQRKTDIQLSKCYWIYRGDIHIFTYMCLGHHSVLTQLKDLNKEWHSLGMVLKLEHSKLEEIESNHPGDVKKCLERVIEE